MGRPRQLLDRPFRGGMGGDIVMNHSAAMMSQNHKNKQHLKACDRHHEKVRRDQLLYVIVEKNKPSLGRRFVPAGHVVVRQNLSVVKYFLLDALLCSISTENETCCCGLFDGKKVSAT